jgi:hypothetical protein
MAKAITDPNNVLGTDVDTIEQITAFVELVGGGDAVAPLAVVSGATPPAFSTVTLTSGVAHVNSSGVKQRFNIGITGGTAGTVGVTVTDTAVSPVVHTIIPVVAASAVASQQLVIDVPAGWSITVTVAVATINASSVVTSGV